MASSLNKAGKKYAERSKSSIISDLLNEDSNNYRRQLEMKGIKPKNHHKQNLKHIENIQKLAQQEKENKLKANNKPKKADKYSKVDSKLKQTHSNSSASLSQNKNTNFILKNMSKVQSQTSLKNRINSKRKPAIPKQSKLSINKQEDVEEKDFVSLNKKIANLKLETVDGSTRFILKKDYGKVPDYIIQRKQQKEELEQKKMEDEEARKIPDGMRKMTESEKLETLKLLEMNKRKIVDSIRALPLVIETPTMIKYQAELNKNFKQNEKTIAVFQKPTVFVAMEQ